MFVMIHDATLYSTRISHNFLKRNLLTVGMRGTHTLASLLRFICIIDSLLA